jgi:hypothetical protein
MAIFVHKTRRRYLITKEAQKPDPDAFRASWTGTGSAAITAIAADRPLLTGSVRSPLASMTFGHIGWHNNPTQQKPGQ